MTEQNQPGSEMHSEPRDPSINGKGIFRLLLIAVIVIPVLSSGWIIYNRIHSREARLRQGESLVAEIHGLYRSNPVQDSSREFAEIDDQINTMENEKPGSPSARFARHVALGRIYQALDRHEQARTHLARAHKSKPDNQLLGFQTALASATYCWETLKHTYSEVDRKNLIETYLEPANQWRLENKSITPLQKTQLRCLDHLCRGRYEQALDTLDAVEYEDIALAELKADTFMYLAHESRRTGNYDLALARYNLALLAWEEVLLEEPSRAIIYNTMAYICQFMMETEINGPGREIEPYYRSGLERINRSLAINPNNPRTHFLVSRLHRRMAEYRAITGTQVGRLLKQAATAARRGLARSPDNPVGLRQLGDSFLAMGRQERRSDQDPRMHFRRAFELYRNACRIQPGYSGFNNLGRVSRMLAREEYQRDGNGADYESAAKHAFEQAQAMDPNKTGARINLGHLLIQMADHVDELQAAKYYEEAIRVLNEVLTINPKSHAAHQNLGLIWYRIAQVDPSREVLQKAAFFFGKALEINPKRPESQNAVGSVYLLAVSSGLTIDFEGDLKKAETAFRNCLKERPEDAYAKESIKNIEQLRKKALDGN